MRNELIIFMMLLLISCSSPANRFVLEGEDKFYLSDSIKKIIKKGYIDTSPLIVIDGVEFKYDTSRANIILPLKKKEITAIAFINKESSHVIYGENADKGAVLINTIALHQYRRDTVNAR